MVLEWINAGVKSICCEHWCRSIGQLSTWTLSIHKSALKYLKTKQGPAETPMALYRTIDKAFWALLNIISVQR